MCKWLASVILSIYVSFTLFVLGALQSPDLSVASLSDLHEANVLWACSDHSDHQHTLVFVVLGIAAANVFILSVYSCICIHSSWLGCFLPLKPDVGPSIPDFIRGCNLQLAPPPWCICPCWNFLITGFRDHWEAKKKKKKRTLSLLSSLKLAAMSAGQINDLAHAWKRIRLTRRVYWPVSWNNERSIAHR